MSPWDYAPSKPSTTWTPPKTPSKMNPDGPELPNQNEPYTLAELVDLALRNSPKTQQTWSQARLAAAQYGQSQSKAFPTLTNATNYTRSKQGSESTGILYVVFLSEWSTEFTLAYTVFDCGQQKATSEAAREALYQADWTHNRAIQTAINAVTNDYYNYLYQKELLYSYNEDIKTAQTTLDAATEGLKMGVKSISDTLQAKTKLLQNQLQQAAQVQQVEIAFATLLNDMGLPANTPLQVVSLPNPSPTDDTLASVEDLLDTALQQRADLLAARANLKSMEKSLTAAYRQYMPTISYNLTFGQTVFDGITDKLDYSSAITLNVPIFSGFSQQNGVRIAQANKEQAEAQLRQAEMQVYQDISTAQSNVRVSFETLKYSDAYLQAAAKQYQVSINQYRAGTTTILDVVSAQSSLADARAKKASAVQQWYTSVATLAYATGTLSPPTEETKREMEERE